MTIGASEAKSNRSKAFRTSETIAERQGERGGSIWQSRSKQIVTYLPLGLISPDRRFITAYNAALQLTTIVVRAAGFRTNPNKAGHHRISIDALNEIIGKELQELSDYLNACRIKRHICDYTSSGEISEAEAVEIIKEIKNFKIFVTKWIKKNHPHFLPTERK